MKDQDIRVYYYSGQSTLLKTDLKFKSLEKAIDYVKSIRENGTQHQRAIFRRRQIIFIEYFDIYDSKIVHILDPIKYQLEIDRFLHETFYKDGLKQKEFQALVKKFLDVFGSKQQISDHLERGIQNGLTIESQLQTIKTKLLNTNL